MDFKSIEKYLIQKDVYRYTNQDELTDILVALNEPFIDGSDKKIALSKDFGIVFYWSEYDDFRCYGDGFIHRVKIIEGVKWSFLKHLFRKNRKNRKNRKPKQLPFILSIENR